MQRRTFLHYATLSTLLLPQILKATTTKADTPHNLILIELKGGNDGLNTVIPYNDPLYYKYRPTIGIPKEEVLKIDSQIGLHPSLKLLHELYNKNEVAIWQGLGYEHPNLSHFRSIEIWDTASKSDQYLHNGWLKKHIPNNSGMIKGVVLGGNYGPLNGFDSGVIKLNNINKFLKKKTKKTNRTMTSTNNTALQHILQTQDEINKSSELLKEKIDLNKKVLHPYEKNGFSKQVELTQRLIEADLKIPFYKLSLGSFDTHINQLPQHARLLSQLSNAIYTLRQNLVAQGLWEYTTIMTYSEFGRRAQENANRGTDHGTAAPHFIVGGNIKSGLFGEIPSLKELDKNGNLEFTTDFYTFIKIACSKYQK